jgi:adenine-specific DNA-methyltransferase
MSILPASRRWCRPIAIHGNWAPHSYLTYLRDRFLLCRELLAPSGSIFVQISDENVHHVRELMDEVFGSEQFVSAIAFKKTAGAGSPAIGTDVLASVADYLLWYCKDIERAKYNQLYQSKDIRSGDLGGSSPCSLQ